MAIASSINLNRINSSAKESRRKVSDIGKSVRNVSQVLFRRTKIKRELFNQTKLIKDRRVENEKRRQIEDEIEAPNVVVKSGGAKQLVQANTSKGFFDRIIGFIGYLSAGWLMNNLPTLIGMGKEFIARIAKAGEIVSGFFNNTIKLFTGVGSILGALGQNLASFDFFDTSNRVKNAMGDLNTTIGNMTNQIEEAFSLITTPLTEGKYSGEDIPETGTQYTDKGAYEDPAPYSGSVGGGRWKPLLDVIASGEGGYESVNPGQVVPGLTNMTIAEAWATAQRVGKSKRGSGAMGRYQLLSDPIGRAKKAGLDPYKDKFSPENQDKIAVYIIENIRGGKEWLSGRLKGGDAAFAQGIANEWAGIPNLSGRYSYSGQGGKVKASSVRSALDQVKKGSSQPQLSQPSSTPITPIVTSRFGAQRGSRMHGGTDLSVPHGTPIRAVADGNIIKTGYDENGWGYYLVYKDTSGLYHLYGHMPKGSYKTSGSVKRGEVIGKVGSTGRSTGPHLHWEVGRSWNGTIGGKFDPLNLYSPNAPFNTKSGPGVMPETPTQMVAPSRQRATFPGALTPERRGQDVIVFQPRSQENIITSSSGGGASAPAINDFQVLNNFIKNKLLLDLAYL